MILTIVVEIKHCKSADSQCFFCILMNMYGIMGLNVGGVNTCSRLLITRTMMMLR